jgi:23S rRNA (adenine2030-N6)-methyltransferase
MLSYRHAFHAGNFADVLKHLILLECLNYLKLKDKPFAYFDTHAGPGMYPLDSEFAQKTHEYDSGISKLWVKESVPEALLAYLECIETVNSSDALTHYPGSPVIAQSLLREQDRLQLCELHNTEFAALEARFRVDRRAEVWHADGFIRTEKLLPPRERRGLILIDPPYELKEDYERVVDFVISSYRKFAQGVYLIWYPVVERARIKTMEAALKSSGIRNIELYELGISADTEGRGMSSSGIIVINPPWTLKKRITPALTFLADILGIDGQGFTRIEQLVEE